MSSQFQTNNVPPGVEKSHRAHSAENGKRSSGVTLRSVLLGLLIVVTVATVSPYSQAVMRASIMTADHFSMAVAVLFFAMFILFNVILRTFRVAMALTPQELVVIFIMGMVGAGFATNGFTAPFLSVITSPYLNATPENRWAEFFYDHIPAWAAVHDTDNALTWYREGLPDGESIPWRAWVLPLFWWFTMAATLVFMSLCIMTILRKQWVENERLVFPLMQVPLAFIQGAAEAPHYPRWLKGKMFWVGFLIPFGILAWNIGGYFSTVLPQFPYLGAGANISLIRGYPAVIVQFYPSIVAIAYFVNLDILAGLWFFYLVGILQIGLFNEFGITSPGYDNYSSEHSAVGWQNMGAFCLLVAWVLWRARHHIFAVLKHTFRRSDELDDSDEFLSYRTAIYGLMIGAVYSLTFLTQLGISLPVACVFLAMVFIIYIGTARIIAESGVAFVRGPMIAQVFTFYSVGTENMSNQTMSGMAMTYGAMGEIKSNWMPPMAQAGKLSEQRKDWGRSIGWVILLASAAGLFTSVFWTIYMAYDYGAKQLADWWFMQTNIGAKIPFDQTLTKMKDPFPPDTFRLFFFGVGSAFMFLFMTLRARFAWWPVHPLGFAFAYAHPLRVLMVSVFFSWLIKRTLLWIGGTELYRKAQPFFLGLLFGYFCGAALSLIVDLIWFPQAGHRIYGID